MPVATPVTQLKKNIPAKPIGLKISTGLKVKMVNGQDCFGGNCLSIERFATLPSIPQNRMHWRMHHPRGRPFRPSHRLHSCIMYHEHGDAGNNIQHVIALDRRRSCSHQLKHKIESHYKNDRLHHRANQPKHGIPTTRFAHTADVAKIDLFEKGKGARDA